MATPLTPVERRRRRPHRQRRRMLPPLVVLVCLAAAGAIAAIVATRGGSPSAAPQTTIRAAVPALRRARLKPRPLRLVERSTGRLAEPVQRDAAAVALAGGRAMLLGGLTAADRSRTDIRLATPAGDRAAGQLPTALHDTAAARIGGAVYLFGGGTGANTQSDEIVRVPTAGGAITVVSRLPSPAAPTSRLPRSTERRTSSAATPAAAGSTRSSPGDQVRPRASSRTCRSRCATRQSRRSATGS